MTSWAPRPPLAPPRFSTTTCWPSRLLRPCATMRAIWSVPPPAGYGQISLIGRVGCQSAWARAGARHRSPSTAAVRKCLRILVLPLLSDRRGDGVTHFGRARFAAEVARERFALCDHLGHRLLHQFGCGARRVVAVLAPEPAHQH